MDGGNRMDARSVDAPMADAPSADGGVDGGPMCTDPECDDGNPCNGVEDCDTISGTCVSGTELSDGTPCTAGGTVCFDGACITPQCGNSVTEPGEQCDDGRNGNDNDGCTDACTRTCVTPADCASLANACNAATCTANRCVVTPANETGPCDDGNECTDFDTCQSGTCVSGAPLDCSSLTNACRLGTCDSATGLCFGLPRNEGGACGPFCTVGAVCNGGACSGGTPRDCSAGVPECQMGSCNATTMSCDMTSRPDGTSCLGGGGFCEAGACVRCGGSGERCCPTAPLCGSGLFCATSGPLVGTCQPCGAATQPCCPGGSCNPPLSCSAGVCQCVPNCAGVVCGPDPVCGTGNCGTCSAPTTCSNGRCCMGLGSPCGTPPNCCSNLCDGAGVCVSCLGDGAVCNSPSDCCTGTVCDASQTPDRCRACLPTDATCTTSSQCCSNFCDLNRCAPDS
jgi:hypothetical protein